MLRQSESVILKSAPKQLNGLGHEETFWKTIAGLVSKLGLAMTTCLDKNKCDPLQENRLSLNQNTVKSHKVNRVEKDIRGQFCFGKNLCTLGYM